MTYQKYIQYIVVFILILFLGASAVSASNCQEILVESKDTYTAAISELVRAYAKLENLRVEGRPQTALRSMSTHLEAKKYQLISAIGLAKFNELYGHELNKHSAGLTHRSEARVVRTQRLQAERKALNLDAYFVKRNEVTGTYTGFDITGGFSLNGRYLLMTKEFHPVLVWDLQNSHTIFKTKQSIKAPYLSDRSFSPDGNRIVLGSFSFLADSFEEDLSARVIALETGESVLELKGHTTPVVTSSWSRDGRFILTGSTDETVKLWDSTTGEELQSYKNFITVRHDFHSIAMMSPNGRYILGTRKRKLVLGCTDPLYLKRTPLERLKRFWQGCRTKTLVGHKNWIRFASFSSDSRLLATASTDSQVLIWEVETGQLLHKLPGHFGLIYGVVISPNNQFAAIASGAKFYVWDLRNGELIYQSESEYSKSGLGELRVYNISISADNNFVIASTANKTSVWSLESKKVIQTFNTDSVSFSQIISQDGRRVALLTQGGSSDIWERSEHDPSIESEIDGL